MKNIKYVTLEEKIKEVQETEKQIKDKPTTERKLLDLCGHLYSLRKKPYKQVKILSDYDTDGIVSAYNMYKFFSAAAYAHILASRRIISFIDFSFLFFLSSVRSR